ncbi:pectate lyase-like adhesive domain-containing protein [Enterococcus mundtii]|uniref:pectate lyase-like adhesive domain-containing protein n=1 Tax=Enterococcus mundtii TaxID=53346 RepID=UPI0023029B4F|nr:pectate lyase-like adhesive domain-containing protein [Enterococcus mundtii]
MCIVSIIFSFYNVAISLPYHASADSTTVSSENPPSESTTTKEMDSSEEISESPSPTQSDFQSVLAVPTAASGIANVDNFNDFRTALLDTTITDIYLTGDITLTASFNIYSPKNIYGDGHTIDINLQLIGVALPYVTCSIYDVTLINQHPYSFFWSEFPGVTVNYTNVTSSGQQFIYLPNGTANLYENVTASSDTQEVCEVKELNIRNGANVAFNNTSNSYPVVGNNSNTVLNIEDNTTFSAQSNNPTATIAIGQSLSIAATSNFSIANSKGCALGSYYSSAPFSIASNSGIGTWKLNSTDPLPDIGYTGPITTSFNLTSIDIAQNTLSVTSNNPMFPKYFQSKNVRKIASGPFTSKAQVVTKDIDLLLGEVWIPPYNFVSATNALGQPQTINDVTIQGEADNDKLGTYQITFTCDDAVSIATVNVFDIKLHSLPTIYAKDTWNEYDGLDCIIEADNSNNSSLPFFEANVSVSAQKIEGADMVDIDPQKLTEEEGEYVLTYTYKHKSKSMNVTVEESLFNDQSIYPDSLDFGNVDIQYTDNQLITTNATGKIDITDKRSNNGDGYKVKVTQDQVLTGVNSGFQLTGSMIQFETGTATNSSGGEVLSTGSNQTVEIPVGEEKEVFRVDKGNSRGQIVLPLIDFKLKLPNDSPKIADSYQAKITWTLSETP